MKFGGMLPTRKRAERLEQSLNAMDRNASGHNEINLHLRVDDDDEDTISFLKNYEPEILKVDYTVDERVQHMGKLYHHCYEQLDADIYFMFSDDMIINGDSWDKLIADIVSRHKDRIILISGDKPENMDVPFTPKEVCHTLGYANWRGTSTWYGETWIDDIIKLVELETREQRRFHVPEVDLVHKHKRDTVVMEVKKRRDEEGAINIGQGGWDHYKELYPEREKEAEKLLEQINQQMGEVRADLRKALNFILEESL